MSRDLEQAVALLLRRFREPVVPEKDLVKAISLTLGWTKPSNAPHLIARAVRAGLLEQTANGLKATIDPNAIDVPFGFRPPEALFAQTEPLDAVAAAPAASAPAAASAGVTDEPAATPDPSGTAQPAPITLPKDRPLLEGLLDDLAAVLGGDRQAAVAEVNAKQQALDGAITLDACALLVAAEHGIELGDRPAELLAALAERSAAPGS